MGRRKVASGASPWTCDREEYQPRQGRQRAVGTSSHPLSPLRASGPPGLHMSCWIPTGLRPWLQPVVPPGLADPPDFWARPMTLVADSAIFSHFPRAMLVIAHIFLARNRSSAPAGAGGKLLLPRVARRAAAPTDAPPVATIRRPAGPPGREPVGAISSPPRRPGGAKECSHGCSAGSPTVDPQRNPWKGTSQPPAPAGAEEAFRRLVQLPTS
jgi:hypothetical protein